VERLAGGCACGFLGPVRLRRVGARLACFGSGFVVLVSDVSTGLDEGASVRPGGLIIPGFKFNLPASADMFSDCRLPVPAGFADLVAGIEAVDGGSPSSTVSASCCCCHRCRHRRRCSADDHPHAWHVAGRSLLHHAEALHATRQHQTECGLL
jgi:hypothetical protein